MLPIETTFEQTTTYGADNSGGAGLRAVELPNLFWAGAIIFMMNVLVAVGILISPDLRSPVNTPVTQSTYKGDRPSPFTEIISERRARIRSAAHIRPVILMQPTSMIESDNRSLAPVFPAGDAPLLRPAVYRYYGPSSAPAIQETADRVSEREQFPQPIR